MNRNKNYNRSSRMHYGDLDQSGSRRYRSENDYSYYPDRDEFSGSKDSFNRNTPDDSYYNRTTAGTRARGDFSGGTRYGEGGSTYGGGSAYGHSSYGTSGKQGSQNMNIERNRSENVQRGYGNMADYESRNYGSFGGSNEYTDFMNHNYGPSNRSNTERGTNRGSTGSDRGYSDFGRTGYGSTGYNNRDEDRERSAYSSNQSSYRRFGADSDRGGYVNKDPNY